MKVTHFIPPNARQEVVEVTNVNAEDEVYFIEKGVKLSMEEVGGMFAVYADTGLVTDGEPDELIEVSRGRSCAATFHALRLACEAREAK